MTKKKHRAVIYCRISDDKTSEAAGVDRQRKDCERYCKDRGWRVAAVEIDNDLSASRYAKKARPGYQAVLAALDDGRADALVAWNVDRLYRQPRELEDLIDRAECGLAVATLGGDFDLATGDGRYFARMLVAQAAKASDDTSRRVRRFKAEQAEAGRPAGGSRAFGYEPDGVKIVPAEARLIRAAAKEVLAGGTMTGVARTWNGAGIRTPRMGALWGVPSVRKVLINPRYAGLRVHQGENVGPAVWKSIVDRTTHERLVRLLTDPSRRHRNPPRSSLLTGLVVCGRCGATMRRSGDYYRCRPLPEAPENCGRNGVSGDGLDGLITEAVLTRTDKSRLPAPTIDEPDGDALRAVEGRLEELAVEWAKAKITRPEWTAARTVLDRERVTLLAEISQVDTNGLGDLAEPRALRRAWPKLSTERRRTAIGALVARIEIAPAAHRGGKFEPDRVKKIKWRS